MRLVMAMLVALGLAVAAVAQDLAQGDGAAIRGVIAAQMEAFARDDGESAFGFASPGIRERFGTAEVFMGMVRSGYQPVYRPQEVRFEPLRVEGGEVVQPVVVVGPDGKAVLALYGMERQADGSWRISGCVLVPLPEA